MEKKVLNLYPIDYPFESLIAREEAGKLKLNPEFQRKYKWDKENNEKTSKFIESCLMRIPLPACYFAEDDEKNHMVIDGVQRITTIKKFFNDEFSLEGLTVFTDLNGKKFSELGDLKNDLENYTIRCIILRNDNKKELIQDIFARLNQGAVELTSQEIRHAIYPGSLDKLLSELGKNDLIKDFGIGKDGKRIKDGLEPEEQVLRFFAMGSDLTDYENFSKYLDSFMSNNQNIGEDEIEGLRNLFNETLEKCKLVFDDNVFVDTTKERPKESMVYYDLLMWSFQQYDKDKLFDNKEIIKGYFIDLCKMDEFQRTLSGGLQNKGSISKRRRLWMNKLRGIDG
ncbi:MAG: hypothetical protein FFODKBPE_00142 [Candidatus Argoarchaeum ethanivorans]|uniref:GmrSD restriction endonucleases N-terminal domain-containing protein n=1 Tax=Candidatus Argoarchaeum ethanivorans TaxID=2608793 RepID=A0A811T2F0_9EURY|nr:MAG: hypothetical protein FFODKBPE_00142 [Candidatus Argoarchaeum ethanivorans]